MHRSLKTIAWTIIDSWAVPSPGPADLTAVNDNEDRRFDAVAREVLAILLGDGLRPLAG